MGNEEMPENGDRNKFQYCPRCGRKGLYHIKEQYHRCRYCGTYLISIKEKPEMESPE